MDQTDPTFQRVFRLITAQGATNIVKYIILDEFMPSKHYSSFSAILSSADYGYCIPQMCSPQHKLSADGDSIKVDQVNFIPDISSNLFFSWLCTCPTPWNGNNRRVSCRIQQNPAIINKSKRTTLDSLIIQPVFNRPCPVLCLVCAFLLLSFFPVC